MLQTTMQCDLQHEKMVEAKELQKKKEKTGNKE